MGSQRILLNRSIVKRLLSWSRSWASGADAVRVVLWMGGVSLSLPCGIMGETTDPADAEFFERRIRPLLSAE